MRLSNRELPGLKLCHPVGQKKSGRNLNAKRRVGAELANSESSDRTDIDRIKTDA
ncbi:MAG: hypothetical protein GDA56_24705 [Hormoscilla sp. GM7CHS1pb]|nr:hypothetical protein [Hormoscilla sp. GM7CHS1pb]